MGGRLTALSPALAVFNPALGEAAATTGTVLKGVGAIGDIGNAIIKGNAARRSDAANVKKAYTAIRGPGNPLEKPR